MKYIKKLMLSLLLLTTFSTFAAVEKDFKEYLSKNTKLESIELNYAGKYVWRAISLVGRPVIQTSFSGKLIGLDFNLWGNYNRKPGGTNKEFTEVDFTLNHTEELDLFDLSMGYIYYDFPTQKTDGTSTDGTSEVFVSIIAKDVKFTPALTFYLDVDEEDGLRIELSGSYSYDLKIKNRKQTLEFSAIIGGWDARGAEAYLSGAGDAGLTDFSLNVSTSFDVGNNITITSALSCSFLFVDLPKDNNGDETNFFLSLSINKSF